MRPKTPKPLYNFCCLRPSFACISEQTFFISDQILLFLNCHFIIQTWQHDDVFGPAVNLWPGKVIQQGQGKAILLFHCSSPLMLEQHPRTGQNNHPERKVGVIVSSMWLWAQYLAPGGAEHQPGACSSSSSQNLKLQQSRPSHLDLLSASFLSCFQGSRCSACGCWLLVFWPSGEGLQWRVIRAHVYFPASGRGENRWF